VSADAGTSRRDGVSGADHGALMGGEGERAGRVGHEQQPLPVDAIDDDARDEEEQRERQRLREGDEPGLRRRAGQREHEQRERHAARPRADGGDHLPGPEKQEVTIPTQRERRLAGPLVDPGIAQAANRIQRRRPWGACTGFTRR
jgi:hypothetical protein